MDDLDIVELDFGFENLVKNDRDLTDLEVVVGHFDDPHQGVPQGMASLGLWLHDGTAPRKKGSTYHIPPRPYLDEGSIEHRSNIGKSVGTEMRNNKFPIWSVALEKEGDKLTKKIQKKIHQMNTPSNTIDTIIKKGADNPLIETQEFVDGVRHVQRKREI